MIISKRSWLLIAVCSLMVLASACKKEKNEPEKPKGAILIATTTLNPDGMSGQSYIKMIPELKGEVSSEGAIPTGFASSLTVEGNDLFVFPEYGPNGKQVIEKYTLDQGKLALSGEVKIIPNSYPVNLTMISPEKAYVSCYNIGQVMIINPKSMTQIAMIDLKPYAYGDNSCEPAYGYVRDGIFYLPLNQNNPRWMPYEDNRIVEVLKIDIKTDKVIGVAKETQSGLCFPVRPYNRDMIFLDEQNNLWVTCMGFLGFNPDHRENGFVCIPAGSQEFDPARSWDISSAPIEGTSYRAASIMNSSYIGNGKVVAFVIIADLMGQNPYTARYNMPVIIDLKTKTIKKIAGVPITDGYAMAITHHDGKVFFSAFGEKEAGVYIYNPDDGTASQALKSKEHITFIHFFE